MRHALLLAALLGTLPAASRAGPADEPHPLTVRVGEEIAICKTGTIQCPAAGPICDDLGVATAVDGPDGLAFQGVGPGQTLCSAGSSGGQGPRRVYRITVVAKGPPRPSKG